MSRPPRRSPRVLHVVVDEQRLERERVAHRADQAELLLPGEDEAAERGHTRLLHRLEEQDVRAARSLGAGRDEEVRAVEVDRVDLLEPNEPGDVDRAARVALLDRLEVGVLDLEELTLRHFPPANELVGLDVALVHGAPPLLLDRRAALAVKHPERDIRLAGSRLRRRREADGDVDETEAD